MEHEVDPTLPPTLTPDATLPASEATVAACATLAAPVSIRAGGAADYHDLIAVERRHYVIGDEIARGGMGRILTARDRRLGRPVAIKELLYESGDARARFEREARITARLQHPAIIGILEAGAWPSGEPFYVMKLVTGESLDKAIADRATLEARLGLLANVIAAVDALAYAHSERVIHRDLKPGNVLVGGFGETVVIDWGLAKDLADPGGALELAAGPYRSAAVAGETMAGSIMGTPAYMPPEQATGAVVDERADVYALGAMLYHLLAGAPPYAGKTTDEVLGQVTAGPPLPLARRSPGAPPDLVTIVAKAMAHDANDRYPTAGELSADLKKFQTGQLVGAHRYSTSQLLRRWLRRHRTAVSVALIAFVVLAALGVVSVRGIMREQAQTEQQREVAELNRGEAEDLLGFMLFDLLDKLAPLGRLDLLAVVAKKAGHYYEGRPVSRDHEELHKRSSALTSIGRVLRSQGNLRGALAQHRAALALREQLVEQAPADDSRRAYLASSHDDIGDILLDQGDVAAAATSYRAGHALRAALANAVGADPERQHDLFTSEMKLGQVDLARGSSSDALAHFRAAAAAGESWVAPEIAWQRDLWFAHVRIADVLLLQGNLGAALVESRANLARMERIAGRAPDDAGHQRDLATSRSRIGEILERQDDTRGALVEHRAALAIVARLAAHDETNTARLREVGVSHGRIGDVLRAQGDAAGALAEYRADLEIFAALASRDPSNAVWQRDLSVSHERLTRVLLEQGDVAGALVEVKVTVAMREPLVAADAGSAGRRFELAVAQALLGEVLVAKGDSAAARVAFGAAVDHLERAIALDPGPVEPRWQYEIALTKLGDLQVQDAPDSALAAYLRARPVIEALVAGNPDNVEWRSDLAFSHSNVADALLAKGDTAGAIAEARVYLTMAAERLPAVPTDATARRNVVDAHRRLGNALLAAGRTADARIEYRAARPIAARLVAEDARNQEMVEALKQFDIRLRETGGK